MITSSGIRMDVTIGSKASDHGFNVGSYDGSDVVFALETILRDHDFDCDSGCDMTSMLLATCAPFLFHDLLRAGGPVLLAQPNSPGN